MQYPIDDYKTAAAETFSRLFDTFKSWNNSWQVANVFDTLTDYLLRYPDKGPAPGAVAGAAYERWSETQASLCWYDDYCWWAIAGTKAFESKYQTIFGQYGAAFQKLAIDCWNSVCNGKAPKPGSPYVYKGAPNVWDNRQEQVPGYFSSAAGWAVPRVQGGVWQYELFQEARNSQYECSPSNPCNPKVCSLGPFQLTVMNALYLELALRLKLQNQGTGTDQAIKNEIGFLKTWFGFQGEQNLLMQSSDGSQVIVRERVTTYASPTGTGDSFPPVEGYQASDGWCGDQGLMLGAMLDFLQLVPSDGMATKLSIAIPRGVLWKMVSEHVIQPYTPGFNDHNDPDDYACGAGVYWRHLLRGFGQNAALRREVLNWVAADPQNNVIYQSAQYAYTNGAPGHKLYKDFNILATLTAAIEILTAAGG